MPPRHRKGVRFDCIPGAGHLKVSVRVITSLSLQSQCTVGQMAAARLVPRSTTGLHRHVMFNIIDSCDK